MMPRRDAFRSVAGLTLGLGLALVSALDQFTIGVQAQSSNGTMTLRYETIASAGGSIGSGNPMRAMTRLGTPAGGRMSNATFTVTGGSLSDVPPLPPGTRTITVQGTVTESVSSVTVNGLAATLTGTSFQAGNIRLTEGANTITVTAVDLAGNRTNRSVSVTLDTRPPARPTVANIPTVTTATSQVLSGTKLAGTSIWINGIQVVPLDNAITWSVTVSLTEGDNVLTIVAKDAAGNSSTTNTMNVVVDNLAPVITAAPPSKTNISPLPFSGTVDDSLTTVNVNGVTASRAGKSFSALRALIVGSNTVTVTATSPRGLVSTKAFTIVLGTVPTLTTLQPVDASKLLVGIPVSIQASATDLENDPIQYQFLVDGVVLADWGPAVLQPRTPSADQAGVHRLTVNARDGFGGSSTKSSDVFVVRKSVDRP